MQLLYVWNVEKEEEKNNLISEKQNSNGRHFSSDAEVIAAAETWLDGEFSDFFSGLQNLQQGAKNCIELRVERPE